MVGAWDHACSILDRLPQFAAVSHPAIAKGLCKLIHTTIEPLYRRYVQCHSWSQSHGNVVIHEVIHFNQALCILEKLNSRIFRYALTRNYY